MGNTFYFEWEVKLMEMIQKWMGDFFVSLASTLSAIGEEMVLIAILGFVYWCYDKKFGKAIGLTIVIGTVINPLIKNVVIRRRPYFDHSGIDCLRLPNKKAEMYDITGQGYSFPSAHTLNTTVIYGCMAVYKKTKFFIILAIVMPLLIGFSRIALGAHYPTDVMAAWVLGVMIVFGFSFLAKKVQHKWKMYAVVYAISLLGLFYCRTDDYFKGIGVMGGFFLADIIEEKFINFKNTKNPLECVIRILGGFITFLTVLKLLELPFSREFLKSGKMSALIITWIIYTVVVFVVLGPYTYLFRYTEKFTDRFSRKKVED